MSEQNGRVPAAVADRIAPADPGEETAAARRRRALLRVAGLVVAAVVLVVLAALSIRVGVRSIPLGTVRDVLLGTPGTDPDAVRIVLGLRVPRTLVGIVAGVCLGLAGAIMQGLTRNPLADPGLFGVDIGAALAIVLAISLLGVRTPDGYVWFAFVGAGVAAVLVYLLGSTGRSVAPEKMVLAGAAVSVTLGAIVSGVLILDGVTFDVYRFWAVGSLAGRGPDVLVAVLPFAVAGVLLAVALARPLNSLALGEDVASALGVNLALTRTGAAIAVTLLAGAATAAAGPIVFVGLAVPHLARLLVGPDQRWVVGYSLLLAPVLLVGADVLGRVVSGTGEIEVGIVTAVLGAPVFLALARRRRVAQL